MYHCNTLAPINMLVTPGIEDIIDLLHPRVGRVANKMYKELRNELDDWMASQRKDGTTTSPAGDRFTKHATNIDVDVAVTEEAYVIYADLPGVQKHEVNVSVMPSGVLNISAERKDLPHNSTTYLSRARSFGVSSTDLRLPKDADLSIANIQASMECGVLKVLIPRLSSAEKPSGARVQII